MRSIISRNAPSRRRSRRYRRAAWRGRRPTRGRRRRNFNSRALNNAYQNPSSRVPESFQRRARRFVRAPLTRPPLLALFLLLFSPPSRPPSLSSPLLSSRYRQFLSRTEGTVLASIIPTSILPWPRWKNLASGLSLSLSLSLPRRRTKPPPALALLRTPASPSPLHLFLFPRPFLLLLLFPAPSPGCDPFRTRSANLPALLAASKREREREREREGEGAILFSDFHSPAETEAARFESVRGDSRIYCGRGGVRACTRGTFFQTTDNVPRTTWRFGETSRGL